MQPGSMLAHYQVEEIIGKGGMGEVYRAHDTKLGRDVALKILPKVFASDSDRLARFEREAKVLASLHHPNIASIFGFETTGGTTFLVMELVEGRDLSEVLRHGAIPVDEAVDIARQIAEGLEEAHEKGIIHRDLKPANVKLSPDGKVKVLDFGLARAYAGQTAGEDVVSSAPTMTAAMTQVGTVLGTAAYMSPEQARGKEVDRRADIWAFGVVLFEMITGKQVFVGETASDTLAGILKSEPDWDSLPDGLPFQVERVLRRCLAKDPRQRLRDIGEARVRLEDPAAESGMFSGPVTAVRDSGGGLTRLLPWVLFAATLCLAVFLGFGVTRNTGPVEKTIPYRFELRTPSRGGLPEVSPDGRLFAYVDNFEGATVVWIRSFAEPEGRPLKGTNPENNDIFWSPDSRSLAYFTEETLEQVNIEGGPARTVCNLPRGWRTVSWSTNGSMLSEVMLNPEEEGWYLWRPGAQTAEKIERPLMMESGQTRGWPTFMPDGEHYVFVHHIDGVRQAALGRIDSNETSVLFPTDTKVLVAADGWYVFSRKGQLLAQAFDGGSFTPVGDPKILSEKVSLFEPNGRLNASVSSHGTILHLTFEEEDELVWFDRQGRELGPALEKGDYRSTSLSPDGRLLILGINDPRTGTGDLWVHDFDRGLSNRLTDTAWAEFSPIWSPDGHSIAFSADPHGPPNLFTMDVNGGAPRELTAPNQRVHYPSDWTRHRGRILYYLNDPKTSFDVWSIEAEGGEAEVLVQTESFEGGGVVSPDGRWLAYASNLSGRSEVYIKQFGPDGLGQRVSIDGGWNPRWDHEGRLFFRAPGEMLMAAALDTDGDRIDFGKPELILATDGRDMNEFHLHPDGRILVGFDTGPWGVTVSRVIVGWE